MIFKIKTVSEKLFSVSNPIISTLCEHRFDRFILPLNIIADTGKLLFTVFYYRFLPALNHRCSIWRADGNVTVGEAQKKKI